MLEIIKMDIRRRESISAASLLLLLALSLPIACGIPAQFAPKPSFREDYYRAANAAWFAENRNIPRGYAVWNQLTEISSNNRKMQIAMLEEFASSPQREGSSEQRLSDLYSSVLRMEERNALGCEPVRPYLDEYRNAQSIKDLIEADMNCFKGLGRSFLLVFSVNPMSGGVPTLSHTGPLPMEHVSYRTGNYSDPYFVYLSELFALSGSSPADAKQKARAVYAFESQIAASAQSAVEAQKDSSWISYPFYLFRTLYAFVDFADIFTTMGFRIPEYVNVSDQGMLEKGASFFTEEHREELSLYAEARLLHSYSRWLSENFVRSNAAFIAKLYGGKDITSKPDWLREYALDAACFWLPNDLGKAFVERSFTQESKRDVEGLIARIVEQYKTDIASCGWMSERTKTRAIEKLDKLDVKVGYPEELNSAEDGAALGTDLCKNIAVLNLALTEKGRKMLLVNADRRAWQIPVFTVNAYYNPSRNEIIFPAGFLQPPIYVSDDSESKKLGMLGSVIGHEISHAFDSVGANYDANGAQRYWWTQSDRSEYDNRCVSCMEFFDGLPIESGFGFGLKNNGALTLNENIADLNGVQCALKVLERTENPDYREFFQGFAQFHRQIETRKMRKLIATRDPHSLPVIRVNRTLSNFGKFLETYGIAEGDRLYAAPEKRVSFW